ncbi:Late promoter-activating protein [Escherichia coli]
MLLNWQGRHFMEIKHSRITSYEIADYMIRTKSLLSAKELAAILEKEYPYLDVDKRDVYLRLKAIAVSKYSSVLIDDSTRPRRFQIHSLNPEFFRRSRAPRRFDEKLQNELYMTQDEKERREHQPWVMARQLFNKVARQHRHYGNATSARI